MPSRLKGETVRVRVYEDRLEVHYAQKHELTTERLVGSGGHRVHYRHVIASLVRKPGAFARYRYREDLFPTLAFRMAYDALAAKLPERRSDLEYLRILKLAAETMECEVEEALSSLLERKKLPTLEATKAIVRPEPPAIPEISPSPVDLGVYDALLGRVLEEVS